MTRTKNSQDFVQCGSYRLPSWLFTFQSEGEEFVSPSDRFDPISALDSSPWQSSTSPSSEPIPKTIILTIYIYQSQHTPAQWLALIHWLEQRGFNIYLCVQNDHDEKAFLYPAKTLREEDSLFQKLERLTSFEPDEDYEAMSRLYEVVRDRIIIFDSATVTEFLDSLPFGKTLINDNELLAFNCYTALRPKHYTWLSLSRKELIKNPGPLLRLSTSDFANDLLPPLYLLLRAFPKQRSELIAELGKTISSLAQLNECIYECPDQIEAIFNACIENFQEKLNKPTIGLKHLILPESDYLRKKFIDCLMTRLDLIQSNSLIAFILEHALSHAQNLYNKKWPLICSGEIFAIFFEIYPEKAEELLASYRSRLNNAQELAEILKGYPQRAVELLEEFKHLITSDMGLIACMKAYPPAAKALFYNNSALINGVIATQFPELSAEFLMADETRITTPFLLRACLQQFPKQAKRLIHDHGKLIPLPGGIQSCIRALKSTDDVKELLTEFLLTPRFRSDPLDILIVVAQCHPRLFFWLAARIHLANLKLVIIQHYAPERYDWLTQQHFDYFSSSGNLRRYFLSQDYNYSDSSLCNYAILAEETQIVAEFPLQDITYLYLSASDDLDYFKKLIEQGKMPNLVVVEITSYCGNREELESFLDAIQKNCPHMELAFVPYELQKDEKFTLLDHERIIPRVDLITQPNPEPKQRSKVKKHSNKLYIANAQFNSKVGTSSQPQKFKMVQAGELLNDFGQTLPRMRTGIVELSEDLTTKHYRQAELREILKPKKLEAKELDYYRKAGHADCYCYFKIGLEAGTTVRLLSVDAQELLLAIEVDKSAANSLRFFRGDDGFYYVEANKACQLGYVIKADSVETQQKKLAAMSRNDPVLHSVNTYLQRKEEGDKLPEFKGDRNRWMDELYEHRSGACRFRCYAVSHAVEKDPTLRNRIRKLQIDNNHMRLEIFDEQQKWWHQVDLGGTDGQLTFTEESIYKPIPLKTEDVKSKISSNVKAAVALASPSKKKESSPLDQWLYKKSKLKPIHSIEALGSKLFDKAVPASLIVSSDLETQALLILEQAKLAKIPIFYLDKPGLYGTGKERIRIDEKAEAGISNKDDFELFLQAVAKLPKAFVLVNWEAFTPQQRVAMNTVIDRKKTLYGKALPESLRIISLCSNLPKDLSFCSRHQKQFSLNLKPQPSLPIVAKNRKIDVKGYPDWQAYLFGSVDLVNNKPVWKKGPLAKALESKTPLCLTITHLPLEAEDDFAALVKLARAEGFFHYHGHRIPFAESFEIKQDKAPFSFADFDEIAVCPEVQVDALPKNCPLINSTLFDYLLNDKKITDKVYEQIDGLIKQHAKKKLPLFISTALSLSQWYCLRAEAEMNGVELELYLAPGVTLPADLTTKPLARPDKSSLRLSNSIYVTNNPKSLATRLAKEQDAFCFAVEDYNYQDLVSRIDYQYLEGLGFCDFEEKGSALIASLKEGKNIVLYGKFSQALLDALAPQILQSWLGQLTLVLEEERLNELQVYQPLSWLPQEFYQISLLPTEVKSSLIYEEENRDYRADDLDLSHSEEEAQRFSQERQALFLSANKKHKLLQLVGHTAVGKTSFMEEIEKTQAETIKVYHELNQFENWALDRSDKEKILCLDDSHMEDQNFMLFAPLINGETGPLLYKGELYPLTEKHKVRFIRNHGVGHNNQKIFASHEVPELHLKEMPPSFIYERMLKPIYRPNQAVPEEEFKRVASDLLKAYLQQKKINPSSVSVRSLQEQILEYWTKRVENKRFFAKPKLKPALNLHFIPTPSTKALRTALKDFLSIHENCPSGFGLHAFYLSGRPGMGKSELIADCFNRMGYRALSSLAELKDKTSSYLKIDASLPLAQKKALSLEAFEHSLPTWLDEANSCMDDGLEKWIKSMLCGINPVTGKRSDKLGFRLVITANGTDMAGRSNLNPAFASCLIHKQMPKPTKLDLETILRKSLAPSFLKNIDTEPMLNDLHHEFETNPNLTLREITPYLAEIAKLYPLSVEILQFKLREAVENSNTTRLQSLLNHPLIANDRERLNKELLSLAVEKNQFKAFKVLISQRPNFEQSLELGTRLAKCEFIKFKIEHKLRAAVDDSPWPLGWAGSRYKLDFEGRNYTVPQGISTLYPLLANPRENYQQIERLISEKRELISGCYSFLYSIFGAGRSVETQNTYEEFDSILTAAY